MDPAPFGKTFFYVLGLTDLCATTIGTEPFSTSLFECPIWIGIMVRVFTNGPGDQGSILGWVISKTQKMVLDTSLLDTQH